MYNLISDNNSKMARSLWQCYRYEPNATLTESESFKFKATITKGIPDDGITKNIKIAVPLKHF